MQHLPQHPARAAANNEHPWRAGRQACQGHLLGPQQAAPKHQPRQRIIKGSNPVEAGIRQSHA
ncbi:hypothetical protein [Hymenobacter sp. DG25B]|uniref:hypothetical protein n=1 Tax=Hymenobacter sp. DG25B TaxID=1385664 RepID=UPI0006623288|nr:hypothetical protein [Hymenobacter sp. DG25B]